MGPRLSSTLAIGLLLVGAVLLANPLYVRSGPDNGSLLLSADRTDPASGVAATTPRVRQVSDLPPVARDVTRQAIENGSFVRSRDDPPLPIQQFGTDWTILGSVSKEQFYRPTVTGDQNRSTLRLEPVSLDTVEGSVGTSLPGTDNETPSGKSIAWLADQSDRVVTVERFDGIWERRLENAIEEGSITVDNETEVADLDPLGSDVTFVVYEEETYRTVVNESATRVTLELEKTSVTSLTTQLNVEVVSTATMSPDTRHAVLPALEGDGYSRAHRSALENSSLRGPGMHLIEHDGEYYLLRIGHADDIDVTPLIRLVLSGLGLLAVVLGAGLSWWSRR